MRWVLQYRSARLDTDARSFSSRLSISVSLTSLALSVILIHGAWSIRDNPTKDLWYRRVLRSTGISERSTLVAAPCPRIVWFLPAVATSLLLISLKWRKGIAQIYRDDALAGMLAVLSWLGPFILYIGYGIRSFANGPFAK